MTHIPSIVAMFSLTVWPLLLKRKRP